ncbi:hypothetical protein PTSG_05295 [Salpingoeca rosetta]|uniref:Brix domain-containing protein n=1 Tax=Salpingoeca rosetta (strain ATCC 50818 / BSB-021) TaxID=946362 RepID=F2UA10_SALR5|nr:uncharacterized protein PTSG_05295 [Salpingoeca rosetta]EGD73585.1 hypothetical protein PTSG_05295 [Salpingoeca rosetta]|eukprot:XP_004993867.1 hypothetical protein PTSG_05295 [Salpingoeca rosetta]
MGRRGKKKSKKGTVAPVNEEDEKAPKTLVINRTPLGINGHHLMLDVRRIMEPYTTSKLRAKRNNVLKDYVSVAGMLGITHFMLFSRTETGLNLRMARVPRGPTLTFRVMRYSLIKDVVTSQPKSKGVPVFFDKPPLLVLNNFNKPRKEIRLMAKLLQNMFPAIKVEKVALSALRRVALFYFNEETEEIELRHYEISVKPVGLSRGIKAVLRTKALDLSQYDDISSFVLEHADGYESDAEAAMGTSKVVLPQTVKGAGNKASQKSAIKLVEIGPRLNLKLIKIEEGLCEGKVLHHSIVHKTPAEEKEIERRRQKRMTEKARRRQQQERNVERKKKEREENRQRSIAGQRAKAIREGRIPADGAKKEEEEDVELWSEDDDNAYYKQEVGEEVPEGMNLNRSRPKKKHGSSSERGYLPKWRQKKEQQQHGKRGDGDSAKRRSDDPSRTTDINAAQTQRKQQQQQQQQQLAMKRAKSSSRGRKGSSNQARKSAAANAARAKAMTAAAGGGGGGKKGGSGGKKKPVPAFARKRSKRS